MSSSDTLPTTEHNARIQNAVNWSDQDNETKRERQGSLVPSSNTTASAGQTEEGPGWPTDWRAYRTLMGCFFLMFNSWGLVNAYGTFSSYYLEVLMPDAQIYLLNLIGSTESFVVLIFSFAVGRLLDAGFSRYILFTGWILVSLGMFLLSLASAEGNQGDGNYALIWLTQGFTTGLGMACFFVASSQIAATWFIRHKSFAIGIVASGASVAGLVYPLMTKYLITSLGFTNAVRCVAGLVCATALLSFLCALPNPEHPLNKASEHSWTSIRRWVDPSAFRNSTFNFFCASIAFMFFGFYAIFFNLEEWAAAKKLGYKGNGSVNHDFHKEGNGPALRTWIYLSVMNASSTIGRLSSGYLSDSYGAITVHTIVMFVSSLLVYIWWALADSVGSAMGFGVVFGAVSGAVIGLPPATVANIIQRSPGVDHSRLGQWTGMMYTIAAPFALTGPVIAGYLITKYDTYITVQMWSGTCLFIASLCLMASMLCARRTKSKSSCLPGILGSAADSLFAKDEENGDSVVPTRDPSRAPSVRAKTEA